MIRWNNDYNRGAHPEIIRAISETNDACFPGYGLDEWCEKARGEIKRTLNRDDVDIHFLVGGTQTNFVSIASILRPYQGVICATSGHINVHETGAIENSGHRIHAVPGVDGKLTAEAIAKEAEYYRKSGIKEHITEPKLVFISFPTEYGTIYTKEELLRIRAVCDTYHLYLYIDGARLGYGLGATSCDVTIEDLTHIADMFYIGGTKCGALFGEALIIMRDELKDHFRSYMKQNGALLAKGWLHGVQFYTLFKDGLYFDITRHATQMAMRIKCAFEAKGIPFYYESCTNQQFVILTESQMAQIGRNHIYEYEDQFDETRHIIRFCTHWGTQESDVDVLVEDIMKLGE